MTEKVDMPLYIKVEGTPYMWADVAWAMQAELENSHKILFSIYEAETRADAKKFLADQLTKNTLLLSKVAA